jgi:hypothetical protein
VKKFYLRNRFLLKMAQIANSILGRQKFGTQKPVRIAGFKGNCAGRKSLAFNVLRHSREMRQFFGNLDLSMTERQKNILRFFEAKMSLKHVLKQARVLRNYNEGRISREDAASAPGMSERQKCNPNLA